MLAGAGALPDAEGLLAGGAGGMAGAVPLPALGSPAGGIGGLAAPAAATWGLAASLGS